MKKESGRGFYESGFPWKCYNCCCHVCTGRFCLDQHLRFGGYLNHCAKCVRSNGELNKVIDCDFFENKLTLPRHFKVKRRFHRSDEIIKRLDAIMEKFEVELPENNSVAGKHNYIDENALKLVREYNRKG